MGKRTWPRFSPASRAAMQEEIEQLSKDRFEEASKNTSLREQLRIQGEELERERRLRRAAEDSSAEALRRQRVAEERLLALLDRYLGRRLPNVTLDRDFVSDFEADWRG